MESEEKKGDWWLRLGDLAPHEVIVVRCPRGRNTEYRCGYLQRRHRVQSDTLVFDLQFRIRCSHCNRRSGFRITILDERTRGDNWKPRLDRVVVAGSKRRLHIRLPLNVLEAHDAHPEAPLRRRGGELYERERFIGERDHHGVYPSP